MRYVFNIDSNYLHLLLLIIVVCFILILIYTFKIRKVYQYMVKVYQEKTKEVLTGKEAIEESLKRAIENQQIIIYLQPKMNTKTEKIESAEALVRWNHPDKGFLSPKDFISVLEKSGVITQLDNYVLEQVFKLQKKWIEQGYQPIPIAVNESRKHLDDPHHILFLKELLEKYQIPASLIELEMTENTVVHNVELAKQAEKNMHALGFVVSMDDFGTGYSSFSMLKDIQIDLLKIDKSFFEEVMGNQKGRDIIESIIEMTKKIKIKTVAEGIETKEQVEYLKQIGCDLIQGYYFSPPIPIDIFEKTYCTNQKEI